MNTEWFAKNKITSPKEVFIYTAWWKYQAKPRHYKDISKVNASQLKVSKKSVLQEIEEYIKKGNVQALQEILGVNVISQKYYPISTLPGYLLAEDDVKNGFYNSLDKEEALVIDYSKLNMDVSKLDGLKFGDYTIILPKTTHEVLRGGYLMRNCMGSVGSVYMKEFMNDPQKYQKEKRYFDAHIIKDNKLVGCLAMEKLLQKKPKFDYYGFFINIGNTGNQEMENLITPVLNATFGRKFSVIEIPKGRSRLVVPSPDYQKMQTLNVDSDLDWNLILDSKK